jgi:hypothetical protein
MKAVIMQVRGKKSIALFSNGRFGMIPTPPGCEEGSVVTIYFNRRVKLLAIILAGILLLGLGVFIGVSVPKGNGEAALPASEMMQGERRGGHGRMMDRWRNR